MSTRFSKMIAVVLVGISCAFAAGSGEGLVSALVIEGGVVQFNTTSPNGTTSHANSPSCCTACEATEELKNEWGTWSFRLNTDDGRAKYALLVYARTNGLQVRVDGVTPGPGNCSSWENRETASVIRLKP